MIKKGTGFLIFLMFTTLSNAQVRKVNRTKETLRHGEITFNDSTTIACNFFYNPLTEEGILFVKQDSITVPCGVTRVRSFSFFDDEGNGMRYFYCVPLTNYDGGNPLGKYFFESIYDNKTISVLGRLTVKQRSNYNPYYPGVRITDHYKKYLLDHRDGKLYELSRKKMLELISDKEEVMNYMYMKHYKLHEKDLDQYFALIDLYSRL